MEILEEISKNICQGDSTSIKILIENALKDNLSPIEILNNGLIAGMSEISVLFKRNEIYVPEVLVAASAMHAGMEILRPLLVRSRIKLLATVIMGTVKGDLHDIGKNLVGIMLEGAGFKVVDIGVDVAPEMFVKKSRQHSADLIAISALLTTTMQMMKITVDALHAAGLKNKTKIMIGGAPVTQHFAKLINADGYAENAASAVDTAKQLLKIV